MSERHVWIAQCLCGPSRHAIAAKVGEFSSKKGASRGILLKLREEIARLLLKSEINPWCGICGAEEANWRYELGRTAWRTMEEAAPMQTITIEIAPEPGNG